MFRKPDCKRAHLRGEEQDALGKIVVASFDGIANRQSATAICKLLKSDVYGYIQTRQNPSRLAGIVMDEFPLVATDGENISGDGFNMQTIRSKQSFVIAATQGFVGLDLSIGAGL